MSLFRSIRGEMETPRLLLREWKPEDFPAFVKFDMDPEVMPRSGVKHSETVSEAQTSFQRALRDDGCYAIVLKETGEPIGKIKFQEDLHRRTANSLSIAYQLRRDMWGMGLMTEALRAMIVCAFERKGADVLAISHFTVNHRSQRVIEKCGFRREGVFYHAFCRFDGQVFDDVCYAMLKEEYFQNRAEFRKSVRC